MRSDNKSLKWYWDTNKILFCFNKSAIINSPLEREQPQENCRFWRNTSPLTVIVLPHSHTQSQYNLRFDLLDLPKTINLPIFLPVKSS